MCNCVAQLRPNIETSFIFAPSKALIDGSRPLTCAGIAIKGFFGPAGLIRDIGPREAIGLDQEAFLNFVTLSVNTVLIIINAVIVPGVPLVSAFIIEICDEACILWDCGLAISLIGYS